MDPTLTDSLRALAARLDGLRVTVIGDVMLDSYLQGVAGRICREAPVPVVTLEQRSDVPGGAANTAANVRALGGEVTLIGVIGADAEAELLRRALAGCGVADDGLVTAPGRATLVKHRVMADAQMLVRFDQGSTEPVPRAAERELVARLRAAFAASDAVIVSDYGYGVMTPALIALLATLQRRQPRVLAVDAKHPALYRSAGVTVAKPNYAEALALLGDPPSGSGSRVDLIAEHADALLERTGAQHVAVTIDSDGVLLIGRAAPAHRVAAPAPGVAYPAGAGDTFTSALALGMAAGADAPLAAELASAAASVVVSAAGTAICGKSALIDALGATGSHDLANVLARVERHRAQGRRIVFTNGCFDILHRGHVAYLNRARELGDVLVVGVNTDESIRRLKGPTRPINTLEDRMHVLGALSCVDDLVAFGEDTPVELIRAIRPDVFVKGGDYTRERLPEAAVVERLGGVVRILPFVDDRSTTRLIARIRESEPAGLAREVGG